ncbi:hypothetical protein MASR2M41_17360 [Flammeovirgaceae bacterium]
MSHVKNAASYSRLVDICTGYGGKYNPGRPTLQLKAMRALLNEAQSSLQDVSLKQDAYHRILNKKSSAFDGLDILANRVIGTMEALQMPEATIVDARYFYRLLAGKRATLRPPIPSEDSDEEKVKTRGFQQLSYVAKASNFFKMVQMVNALPAYISNEPDLQIPALMERAAPLQSLIEEVDKAKVALSIARLKRNRILYRTNTGMVDNAKLVRRYVKVAFGTRSGEAAQLKDVRFTKQKVR